MASALRCRQQYQRWISGEHVAAGIKDWLRPGRRRLVAVAVVAQLIVLVPAFRAGASRSPYVVHVGRAYYGTNEVTITYKGWSYGGALPDQWHDAAGWHEGGHPSCMPHEAGAVADLRFATVDHVVPPTGVKPLLWIDCSGSRPDPA